MLTADIERAATIAAYVPTILAAVDGDLPEEDEAGLFLRRLDRMPHWTPFESARETWDDIIATGNLNLVGELDLRQQLSAYYNRVERLGVMDRDMDEQLTAIEMGHWELLEPARRMAIIRAPDGQPTASLDEVRLAMTRIRADRRLHSRLVQVQFMNENIANAYRGHLELVNDLLSELHARAH